jgi:hypothetical protein
VASIVAGEHELYEAALAKPRHGAPHGPRLDSVHESVQEGSPFDPLVRLPRAFWLGLVETLFSCRAASFVLAPAAQLLLHALVTPAACLPRSA